MRMTEREMDAIAKFTVDYVNTKLRPVKARISELENGRRSAASSLPVVPIKPRVRVPATVRAI